jgi:hypothetical protein
VNSIVLPKWVFRSVLLEQILGVLDYLRYPHRGVAWGGPFNGQPARQALFREIVAKLQPYALIETGTHLGTTTQFLAETELPVFSIEMNCRVHGFARARLRRRRNITLLLGDSRTGLCRLLRGPLCELTDRVLFFYLDAHWNEDLPLAEEVNVVFRLCPRAVVMIDDFKVPYDPGYGYDDYGPRKALTADYIAPVSSMHALRAFYPSTPSAEEGGWRRGCVVLSKLSSNIRVLSSIPLLRWDPEVEATTV